RAAHATMETPARSTFVKTRRDSPPQQAANRAAHQRAADRSADRAADGFAEIGHHPAHHLVGDRARNVSRDELARRQSIASGIGAENRPDDRAKVSENSAAGRFISRP